MVPVPKKQRVPLSAKNARRVLFTCHLGKIYSGIVRAKIQHLLPEAAQGRQSGRVKGGSTEAPQLVLSLFIKKMSKEKKCAAALLTDIKAAFYSVFAEVALGSLLPTGTREQLFDKAGLSWHVRHALRKLLAEDEVVPAQGWNWCGDERHRTGTLDAPSG